tara:strand:+ start:2157 stop:2693 length:537 start_codon:yes stop_codon:yes gene_type:complete
LFAGKNKMKDCPCGSNFPYTDCCGPLIRGTSFADTAEDLMRSRYTAFTENNWEYLVLTSHPQEKKEMARLESTLVDQGAKWKRLEITRTLKGGREDNEGQVDFVAHYVRAGTSEELRESSKFYKINGHWVYSRKDSILSPVPVTSMEKPKTLIRDKAKVGRNDPCPCGSGKKYKKCCL